eukprot:5562046-Pleurochrysis_carterae.AAC.2
MARRWRNRRGEPSGNQAESNRRIEQTTRRTGGEQPSVRESGSYCIPEQRGKCRKVIQSDHLRHPVRQREEANKLGHSAVARWIVRHDPLRMRRRLTTLRLKRPERMRRTAEFAFEGATRA